MKYRSIAAIVALLLCAAFLLGFSGAVELAGKEDDETAGRDCLVGVYVTAEYLDLFDIEAYLNDNAHKLISGGDNIISREDGAEYEGRIYADWVKRDLKDEDGKVVSHTYDPSFTGLGGYLVACYEMVGEEGEPYTASAHDEGFADCHLFVNVTDEGTEHKTEAVLYVDPRVTDAEFYFNPVYQDADGELYLVSGSGSSFSGDHGEGMIYGHTLSDSVTVTVDGESETKTTSIKIDVHTQYPPESVVIHSFSESGTLLESREYDPNSMPEEICFDRDAEYAVVESVKEGWGGEKLTERSIIQPKDESMSSFYSGENGILLKQYTSLKWNGSES